MAVYIAGQRKGIKQSARAIISRFKDSIDFSKGVILKPNIVFPVSAKGGDITRHAVVQSVVEILREDYGVNKIVLGEGTAAGTVPFTNFKVSGYLKLTKSLNVDLVDLHEEERVPVEWKYGTIRLPKIIFEKAYINLPILKVSSAAIMSGAMKNQKGLLAPEMKKRFHRLGLHKAIAALAETIQPSLTIMDGSNFFEDDVLIGGTNLYEIDSMVARALAIEEPPYLGMARDYGLGKEGYEVLGWEKLKLSTKKKFVYRRYKRVLRLGLWSNPRACSMCRFTLDGLRSLPTKDFYHTSVIYLKLLKHSIKGVDFVFGSRPEFDQRRQNVICIGDCTKQFAQENGYIHVPGCPPTTRGMAEHL